MYREARLFNRCFKTLSRLKREQSGDVEVIVIAFKSYRAARFHFSELANVIDDKGISLKVYSGRMTINVPGKVYKFVSYDSEHSVDSLRGMIVNEFYMDKLPEVQECQKQQ